MRLDHLLSKEHHQDWWPSACPSVVGVVAHGWNINESALHRLRRLQYGPCFGGLERAVGLVRGGGTLLGYEAARSPRFLGVCGWSSLRIIPVRGVVVGVGLFFENCIVDASIL